MATFFVLFHDLEQDTVERWEKRAREGDQRWGPYSVCTQSLTEEEKQASLCLDFRLALQLRVVVNDAFHGLEHTRKGLLKVTLARIKILLGAS
jgi:hypothetical protein